MKWDIATTLFLCLTWPQLTQAQVPEPTEEDGWLRSPDGQVSILFLDRPEPKPPHETLSLIDPSEPALPFPEEESTVASGMTQAPGGNQDQQLRHKSQKKARQ
jgi:hypothetical protein